MVTAVIDVIHCRGKDNHCLHAPIGGVRRSNKAKVNTPEAKKDTPRALETVDNLASRSALTCKANAMHRHVGPFSLLSVPNRLSIPCSVIDRGWFVSSESGFPKQVPPRFSFPSGGLRFSFGEKRSIPNTRLLSSAPCPPPPPPRSPLSSLLSLSALSASLLLRRHWTT